MRWLENKIVSNFASLFVLQVSNYVLPLLTLPYILRVIGPDKYGELAFATAFVAFFAILIDYGFNLSATQKVAHHQDDVLMLSEIYSTILTIKGLFFGLSLILMGAIVVIFERFESNSAIYFFTFASLIWNWLFPQWLFQGVEKMRYITYVQVGTKVLYTVLIFLLIFSKEDYYLIPIINAFGSIVGSVWAIWYAKNVIGVRYSLPSLRQIRVYFVEGWDIFVSTIFISFYTNLSVFILGLFATNTVVGYFAAAQKIITIIQGFIGIVSQVLFPRVSHLIQTSRELGIAFIKKSIIYQSLLAAAISLFLYLAAPLIITIVFGDQFVASVEILQILSILPLIVTLANVFAVQTMLPLGMSKAYRNIYILMFAIALGLYALLIPDYQDKGLAIAIVLTETIGTLAMGLYLYKKRVFA